MVTLKQYREKIDKSRCALAQTWCLCKYYQLYDSKNESFVINLKKLEKCIADLKFLQLEDCYDKTAILVNELIYDNGFNDAFMIYLITEEAFEEIEDDNGDKREKVCEEFVDYLDELIEIIAYEEGSVHDDICCMFNCAAIF